MKKKHEYIAMSREEARDNLMRKAVFTPKTENIPIEEAVGRVAAADVKSLNDSPNIHASRMDGIAVHFDDFKDGIPDTSDWKEGHEYVFCNTGIGIPGDYDTVYKIEDVELEDGRPVFSDVPPERGTFITPAGSNMKKGDLIVRKGDRLSPLLLSLLATGGYAEAEVIERPVVAFIPTGNELVPPGEKVPDGKNTDSNSVMMRTKILLWGGKPLMYPIQPDKPETLIETLKDALSRADIVVINGGSSEGSDDFTIEALNAVGTVQNHVIYNGPGAHTSCAVSHEGKPIVGIPGPAIGAEYVADWFIKPLIDSFFGLYEPEPSAEAVYHGPDFPERDSLFSMIRRARLERKEDGTFTVEAVEFDDKRGMDLSNAFIAFTPQGVHDGDVVRVSLRYPYRFI